MVPPCIQTYCIVDAQPYYISLHMVRPFHIQPLSLEVSGHVAVYILNTYQSESAYMRTHTDDIISI